MASVVVDVVLEKLGGMLIEEINKEVSLVCNFRSDFEWLSKKLTNIKDYLRDADAQIAHNASVNRWLLDVAEIALDAEDILDECAVHSKGTHSEISETSCVCSAFSYSQLVFRYKMARRIKDVKARIGSIMKDGKELKLVGDVTHSNQPSTSTAQNVNWRGFNMIERDSHPVAIESKVEEILHLLDDPAAPVIAVVGMGGVGKTFLMQNVFSRIKDKFEKSIWLAISQTYSLKKLQASLAMELDLNEVVNERVDEVKAAELIHGRLASRKFLIVLDDVWRATEQENLVLALGIPRGNNPESKIVVTTRSRHVSSNMNARVYELQPLSKEESWNLFCAFAFKGNQPTHHLEGIARQVEGECGKLPLAVKIVAASLANTTLSREWESKLQQLRAASSTEDPIMQILKLSYDSLPAHLKSCFAYLSFFPEGEEIDSQYLINLWIAEGYVPHAEYEDQLDIGWNYLCHLQSLCLVERVSDIYDQAGGMFKLHNLLFDLAISIGKESKYAFSAEESFKNGPAVQTSSGFRRILMGKKRIADGDVDVMASSRTYSASRLRTLSLSQNGEIQNIPAILLNSARVLRVLDLSGTNILSLPTCVGNLKLLRVLNLSETKITEVPKCLKGNKNLHFLDISKCRSLERFPEWIGELNQLEHLDLRGMTNSRLGGLMPSGISKLLSLQVLRSNGIRLSILEDKFLKLEHFINLVNLREMFIDIHHEAELECIEDGILAPLVKMRNLTLRNMIAGYADVCNLPSLSEQMLTMKDLNVLSLCLFAVPYWICGFSNLMQLTLIQCHCVEYPALELMPNLLKFELVHNVNCKALPRGFGRPAGFPQLRYFRIDSFSVLEELSELKDGAMPRLEILDISFCPNLKKIPCGLELLRSLRECIFFDTGVSHMFQEGGELWNKIKANNPVININCSSTSAIININCSSASIVEISRVGGWGSEMQYG